MNNLDGRFVPVNGVNMYYEEHGQGYPIILIHGGILSSSSWVGNIPTLSKHFRVITPDSRAHGRTNNPAGALSYRTMADDIAALIEHLNLQRPIVGGWSDGGQICLELGMHYPDIARALIVGAAWYKFSDMYAAFLQRLGISMSGDVDMAQTERVMQSDRGAFVRASHHHGPDYWKTLLRQIAAMWITPLNYTAADFAKITSPTLVLIGDRDETIPVEQAVDMYRFIPNAELAVSPNSTHWFFMTHANVFNDIVLEFARRHSGEPVDP